MLCSAILFLPSAAHLESSPASVKHFFLKLWNFRSLHFESATQGDPAETVVPDGRAFGDNAVFLIHGIPFHSVYIFLPQNEVYLRQGSSSDPRRRIRVHSFQSLPQAGQETRLNFLGLRRIFVGATRERLQRRQASGRYEGSFVVTVVYP